MATRILNVDDNADNRYLLESLLKASGFEVISAENGRDALEKAQAQPPDLIVSDILMPVMDGYALCRAWKSDEQLKYIPFVFYTATYTEPKDKKFALSLGAERFLLKPQEPDLLIKIFKEVLEDKNSAKQPLSGPLGKEVEYFRQYNEILFRKLEKKMSDLETANRELRRPRHYRPEKQHGSTEEGPGRNRSGHCPGGGIERSLHRGPSAPCG
jgi:hypothetical protein